jgi:hypothetical protein
VIGILGSLLVDLGSDLGSEDGRADRGSGSGCADATLVIATRATVVLLNP